MRERKFASILLAFSLLSLSAPTTFAQKQQVATTQEGQGASTSSTQTAQNGKIYTTSSADGGVATYVSSFGYKDSVVKGQPMSAQAVTETIQILADGNRIIRKSTTTIYRDSEGRTRREQTLSRVGPYTVAGDPPQIIFINDPVAGTSITLDPRTRIARKFVYAKAATTNGSTIATTADATEKRARERSRQVLSEDRRAEIEAKIKAKVAKGESKGQEKVFSGSSVVESDGFAQTSSYSGTVSKREKKKESLGKQMMEGVDVEGTRYTTTIPAGEIGNEQPINIVEEKWFSQELQQLIYSKTTDPRFGETIYRLTNISRLEPDRSLFEIPSDYTIKESKISTTNIERKIKREDDLKERKIKRETELMKRGLKSEAEQKKPL